MIEIEQAGDENLDLIIGQVTECWLQEWCNVFLNVEDVVRYRSQHHRDLVGLDQREHICKDLSVHLEAGGVRCVCNDAEDLHQDVGEICLIEALGCLRMLLKVLQ